MKKAKSKTSHEKVKRPTYRNETSYLPTRGSPWLSMRKAKTPENDVNIVHHFHGHLFLWKYMEYDILALCAYLAFPLCTF